MAEAVAADGARSERQDVAQVAGYELGSGHCLGAAGVAAGAILPGKSDALIIDGEEARVADGCAANVGAEIFDGVGPVAEGLQMDTPVLVPHRRIDGWQVGVLPQLLELLAEEPAESAS